MQKSITDVDEIIDSIHNIARAESVQEVENLYIRGGSLTLPLDESVNFIKVTHKNVDIESELNDASSD